jgi:hypothetical protein
MILIGDFIKSEKENVLFTEIRIKPLRKYMRNKNKFIFSWIRVSKEQSLISPNYFEFYFEQIVISGIVCKSNLYKVIFIEGET